MVAQKEVTNYSNSQQSQHRKAPATGKGNRDQLVVKEQLSENYNNLSLPPSSPRDPILT